MSVTEVHSVLERSMEDPGFVDTFRADPERALADYELSDREEKALRSGDQNEINDVLGEIGLGVYVLPVPIVT
ncbi:Os1348 family NHLP clan protein [Halovivax sp.]|uniref:Os1348 family NHLP clan protein n=1 Tax=Halovivax sp. TaxID=1935978 RepID=UPI0025B7B03C|nr:Os1348 family NHLP clan protein [Halovivax sp.]